MMHKRSFPVDEDDSGCLYVPTPPSKRLLSFSDSSSSSVMGIARGFSSRDLVANLEPLIRKVVSEEVARVIQIFVQESEREPMRNMESWEEKSYELHFVNTLPKIIFTGNKIEGADGSPVKVVLRDVNKIEILSMSTIRIEILVLDGDFATGEEASWTHEEFNANIIQEREGKRPLLSGELALTLKDGIGYLNDVSFTDNSSWTRSRRFRLGARVSHGDFKIREAKSKAFIVKDHRGELYKKHHPPSLGDDVWRLEKIAKDGVFHRRLTSNGVHNVRDFLRLFNTDYSLLRNMLVGVTSTKIWGTIIEHAHECVLDDELHVYYSRDSTTLPTGLLFDSVYKVVGLIFDGTFLPINKLSPNEMVFVDTLKRHAYENLKDVVKVSDPCIFTAPRRALSLQGMETTESFTQPKTCGLQPSDLPIYNPGELESGTGWDNSTMGAWYEPVNANMTTDFPVDFSAINPQLLQDSVQESDIWSSPWVTVPDWDPVVGAGGLFFGRGDTVSGLPSSSSSTLSCVTEAGSHGSWKQQQVRKKRRAGWCKIRAAVKWGIGVRRDLAYRRLAHILFTC